MKPDQVLDKPAAGLLPFSANQHFIEQLIGCKQGVVALHRSILAGQKILDHIGTRKDSEPLREKLEEVIATIKTRILQMERVHVEMEGVEKKLKRSAGKKNTVGGERIESGHIAQRKKLKGDLKKEKANFKVFEKKVRVKIRQFPPPSPASRSQSGSFGNDSNFKLGRDSAACSVSDIGKDGEFLSMDAVEKRLQSQMVVEGELEVNEALIRERHEAMVDIYKQLEEVNDIFKDLAKLVDEQTDDIIEISENVEVTHAAAENALEELKTAQEIQKKSSCSMM
jgi:hypothetical protein